MRYGGTFSFDKITSGLQQGLKQGVGAVKKSAMAAADKTGKMTRQGVRQLTALQKKSRESIKKVFKRVA